MRMSVVIPTIFCFAFLSACQSTPEMTGQIDPMTGLRSVENTAFDKFSVESADSLRKYKAIYFAPLDLSHLEIDARRLDMGERNWPLSDTEKSKIIGYFSDSVMSSFKDSSIALANGPGENVLTAAFSLTKFTPSASKDDARNRMARDEVFTYNVGDLEMKGLLKDSISGYVLGSIEDTDKVGDTMQMERNDRINNTRKLKNTFSKWTKGLASAFDTLNMK